MNADLFIYALPAFALLMVIEWIDNRRDPDRPANGIDRRDTTSNIATFVLGRVAKPLLAQVIPFSGVVLAAHFTPLHLSPEHWWVWVLGLIVTDFCYYWAHRADHRVRLLWTSHSVHHSSRFFNFSTAIRLPWAHPAANIVRGLCWVPAALLGFPAWMVFALSTSSPSTPSASKPCGGPWNSCSTPRPTTASTTAPTSRTWTPITAGSSSSGIACSAASRRKPNRFATG